MVVKRFIIIADFTDDETIQQIKENTRKIIDDLPNNSKYCCIFIDGIITFHPAIENSAHIDTFCDNCKAYPLTGLKYHCLICKDYDLCENCAELNIHDHDMRIINPEQFLDSTDYCKKLTQISLDNLTVYNINKNETHQHKLDVVYSVISTLYTVLDDNDENNVFILRNNGKCDIRTFILTKVLNEIKKNIVVKEILVDNQDKSIVKNISDISLNP